MHGVLPPRIAVQTTPPTQQELKQQIRVKPYAFVGNGAVYFLLYALLRTHAVRSRRSLTSFVYWFSLMSAANVWGYVPLRVLTTHADMAIAARGLGISTWVLFPFLMVPALYIVYHFFCRNFPGVYATISSGDNSRLIMLIALTAFWYFSFFAGNSVISGDYGLISQIFAILSRYLLFPLAVIGLTSRYANGPTVEEAG